MTACTFFNQYTVDVSVRAMYGNVISKVYEGHSQQPAIGPGFLADMSLIMVPSMHGTILRIISFHKLWKDTMK